MGQIESQIPKSYFSLEDASRFRFVSFVNPAIYTLIVLITQLSSGHLPVRSKPFYSKLRPSCTPQYYANHKIKG